MPNTVFRTVLVGLGNIGLKYDINKSKEDFIQTHARAFSLNPGFDLLAGCLLYTSPSPRDGLLSRMPSSA